jgi:hypothetical protein
MGDKEADRDAFHRVTAKLMEPIILQIYYCHCRSGVQTSVIAKPYQREQQL